MEARGATGTGNQRDKKAFRRARSSLERLAGLKRGSRTPPPRSWRRKDAGDLGEALRGGGA